jgi:hypothetical protein
MHDAMSCVIDVRGMVFHYQEAPAAGPSTCILLRRLRIGCDWCCLISFDAGCSVHIQVLVFLLERMLQVQLTPCLHIKCMANTLAVGW